MENTKYIILKTHISENNDSIQIGKRENFNFDDFKYMGTNKDNKIHMDEYCLIGDSEYFYSKLKANQSIQDKKKFATPEEKEQEKISEARNAYGHLTPGMSIEEFCDNHMNLKIPDPILLKQYGPELENQILEGIKILKEEEYKMYLLSKYTK
jgi:hypothetical protein